MQLVPKETREPLAVALASCPEWELPLWKDELCSLSIELAKTFHGSQNEKSLRSALEDAVNLCGIAILKTAGPSSENWWETVRHTGIRALCRKMGVFAKELSQPPPNTPFLVEHEETPTIIIKNALAVARTSGPGMALKSLETLQLAKAREGEEHAFCLYLAQTKEGKAAIKRLRNEEAKYGNETEPNADPNQQKKKRLICTEFLMQTIPYIIKIPHDKIPDAESHFEGLTPPELAPLEDKERDKAERYFKKLVASTPEEMRGPLLNAAYDGGKRKSWFAVHVN